MAEGKPVSNENGVKKATRCIPLTIAVLVFLFGIASAYFSIEKRVCMTENTCETVEKNVEEIKHNLENVQKTQIRVLTILEKTE